MCSPWGCTCQAHRGEGFQGSGAGLACRQAHCHPRLQGCLHPHHTSGHPPSTLLLNATVCLRPSCMQLASSHATGDGYICPMLCSHTLHTLLTRLLAQLFTVCACWTTVFPHTFNTPRGSLAPGKGVANHGFLQQLPAQHSTCSLTGSSLAYLDCFDGGRQDLAVAVQQGAVHVQGQQADITAPPRPLPSAHPCTPHTPGHNTRCRLVIACQYGPQQHRHGIASDNMHSSRLYFHVQANCQHTLLLWCSSSSSSRTQL